MSDLRQSNTDRLGDKIKPDGLKSTPEKIGDEGKHTVDTAASYLPGQSKARDALNPDARDPTHHTTHDAGRGGLGTTGDALKPSGEQTVGEWAKTKVDQAASIVQPNAKKSVGQDLKDTATPGHDSSLTHHGPGATATNEQGVLGALGQKVVDAKDAVVGALSGASSGAHDGVKRSDL